MNRKQLYYKTVDILYNACYEGILKYGFSQVMAKISQVMAKNIINISLLWFLIFYCLPALSQTKTWPLKDKAVIAGFLFNPGFKFGFKTEKKRFSYECYYDDQYMKKDSSELVEKAVDFLNFFSFFVTGRKRGIVDSVRISMCDFECRRKIGWSTKFENMGNQKLDATNRMLLLSKALVCPVDLSVYGGEIILEFNLDLCPKTKETFDKEKYVKILAWVIKDFVINDNNNFGALRVCFKRKNKKEICNVDLNDKRIFDCMYDHTFFRESK